jgi:mannose-6-phosphate isomerase-like protein (cupin superfamily)
MMSGCRLRAFSAPPSPPAGLYAAAADAPSVSQLLNLSTFSLVTGHMALVTCTMSFIDLEQLPFVGMSYEFVGETQGAPFSAYIVKAKPGQGPPLHKHPYVEVAFTLEGCATITVGDEQREVKAGGIVVIPANTPHRFVNSGNALLRQIDVHASPRFIQTNL